MEQVYPQAFVALGTWKQWFRHLGQLYATGDDDALNQERIDMCTDQFKLWEQDCKFLGLPVAGAAVQTALSMLENPIVRFGELDRQTHHFFESYEAELRGRVFLRVDPTKYGYLDGDDVFDQSVVDRYPEADIAYDITEAAHCLAFDRSTAAVFHLMRVVEYGLRDFARKLDIKFPKPNMTIEKADWNQLLEGIDGAIDKMRGHTSSHDLEKTDLLYVQFNAFKNAFRNPVSHLRGKWTPREADVIWVSVKSFMERIAKWPTPEG